MTTTELADPVLAILAMLQHNSAVVRHAALETVQRGGAGLSSDDCLYVYQFSDWHLTAQGTNIIDRVERHYIAAAIAIYDNSVRDLDRVRTWRWVTPRLSRMDAAAYMALGSIITLIVLAFFAAIVR